MKKFSRYGVCIIVVLFFLLINTPIYAYESSENWHNKYVYDNEKTLEEAQEEIRETLKDFYIQTSIKVIVVTLRDEEDKTGGEIIQTAMQKYKKENMVVILLSMNRKLISCSYEKVNIFPYVKSILSISENEYNEFAKKSVVNMLKEIAHYEGKYFSTETKKVNFLELLADENLGNMINGVIAIVSVIIIIFVVIVLVIFVIRLCIEQIIDYFSS